MKPGRKPKPTLIKDLEGTRRADREAPNLPDVEPGVPELPAGFGESVPWGPLAVEEYFRMSRALKDIGLLSEIDRAAFLLYCDAWARWMHYRNMIGERGDTQMSAGGFESQNSYVQMMNKAADEMRRTLSLFGLSPADRTRVSASQKKQPDNPFAKYA